MILQKLRAEDSALPILASLLFFGTALWMKSTVDPLGWAFTECLATVLLMRLLWIQPKIFLPTQEVFLPALSLVLFSTLSLLWSAHFHATWTAIYKEIFILILIILFTNQTQSWRAAMELSLPAAGLAAAGLCLAGPAWLKSWIDYPNLMGGFLLLSGISCVYSACRSQGVRRWFFLAASAIILCAQFFLSAMAPFLISIVAIPIQLTVLGKKKWSVGYILFSAGLLGALGMKSEAFMIKRKLTDPHALERVQIWKDSLKMVSRHSILGTGLGTFRDMYPEFKTISGPRSSPYAHNEVLNFICEMGLVGSLILIWALFNIIPHLRSPQINLKEWLPHWGMILFATAAHSLVDFNLHYPPILVLVVFSLSLLLPKREAQVRHGRELRLGMAILFILFLLPGWANYIFIQNIRRPEDIRQSSARRASILDPFNGAYRFEGGRMRDIETAILLEPRNPWYRRAAAQFLMEQWEATHRPEYYNEAQDQYLEILRIAPNVPQFIQEAQEMEQKRKAGPQK